MEALKEMPFSERYTGMLDYTKLIDTFVLPFVKNRLGEPAAADLQKIWKEGAKAVPENASIEEKYDLAYGNWLWKYGSSNKFVQEKLGDKGVGELQRNNVEALKQKNSSPALYLLKMMRVLSPGTAFRTVAKQFLYQLQVFGSYPVSELSASRLVMSATPCKILDFPGGEEGCSLGCQTVYPIWLKEQLRVNYKTERQGKACAITITPL